MSVAVPVIDHIDPDVSPRLVFLKVGVRSYHPIDDIYAEVRNLRRLTGLLRQYDSFVTGGGNIKKLADGSKRTPRFLIFNNTKVVPEDVNHDLEITGEQLFAPALGAEPTGLGAAAIDKTPLSAGVAVNIDYAPAEAEVIVVGLSPNVEVQIDEMHKIQGLDPLNPVVTTPITETVGDIVLDMTGDADTITTTTRRPP